MSLLAHQGATLGVALRLSCLPVLDPGKFGCGNYIGRKAPVKARHLVRPFEIHDCDLNHLRARYGSPLKAKKPFKPVKTRKKEIV
jgi:hypothetical protein